MKIRQGETEEKMMAIRVLTEGGFSLCRAIAIVGSCYATYRKHGGSGNPVPLPVERDTQILSLYREGLTLEQVSLRFNITRERVRQILRKNGVSALDGGAHLSAISNQIHEARERQSRKDRTCMGRFGCDWETAVRINGATNFYSHRTKTYFYFNQRHKASDRGIDFDLTLPQWWEIWEQSGKWEMRGRGKGRYCMARHGDAGPYGVGNVYITTNDRNAAESYDFRPVEDRHRAFYVSTRAMGLTPRQKQILDLSLTGLGPKAIAAQLGIARGTVATQLSAARHKERRRERESSDPLSAIDAHESIMTPA